MVSILELAGGRLAQRNNLAAKPREGSSQMPAKKSIASLEAMGVRIYGLDAPHQNNSYNEISWDNIAGYDQQKRYVKDSMTIIFLVFPFSVKHGLCKDGVSEK